MRIGIGYYFYKVDSARKSLLFKPTAVVPTPEPNPLPEPVPKDATQRGLEEAIDAKDVEKLRSWLSELLLQGWPEPKYAVA